MRDDRSIDAQVLGTFEVIEAFGDLVQRYHLLPFSC